MRLVLTNDDGIEGPGLHALAAACAELGHEVLVAAPSKDMSGAAASIGRLRPDQLIDTERAEIPGLPQVTAHALAGPPGLAAMAACLGAFGPPPEAIVSGINAGPNTGHAVLHSGTVGAALTAATFGVSALAVSVDVSEPMCWRTARPFVDAGLELLSASPAGTVLNINVPAVPPGKAKGLRWANLDRFGLVRVAVAGTGERWLQMEYRETGAELDPESDTALLLDGYATITALEGIAAIAADELEGSGIDPKAIAGVLTEIPERSLG